MYVALLIALLGAVRADIPPDVWRCENQVEVWCTGDSCAAKDEDETTPLDIWATTEGRFAICAYTGCWEGEGAVTRTDRRLLWTARDVEFLSGKGGFSTDVTLLISEDDGVGFVRVSGFASPVICRKAPPGE